MLISQERLQHWIDNFYGYGTWSAPIWFVAYEESGGDLPQEVSERLDFFHLKHHDVRQPALCDIRDLFQHVLARLDGPRASLFKTLYDYRFGPDGIIHGIWKNLIAFQHGYRGEALPDLLSYQKSQFVSAGGYEAMIQFYPLPSPHNHAWYYSWLDLPQSSFLRARSLYESHVYPDRVRKFLEHVEAHSPEVVLIYGMNNINLLKKSVQEYFPSAKFRMVKAVHRQIPQYHRADFNRTTLLLTTQTPALKHNRIEMGFEWEDFGKLVKTDS